MKICVIGCGAMGGSMATGLAPHQTVHLFDHNFSKAKDLAGQIGAKSFEDTLLAIKECELVIVAVKPYDMEKALSPLLDKLSPEQIIISVAGGVSVKTLTRILGKQPVVRIMPNTACALGKGVIGCVESEMLSKKVRESVDEGLSELGSLHWLPESKIDALTAVAGSAPAFAFIILESMIDAGIEMGLSASLSKELVCEMWQGSIALLQKTSKGPSDLKWEVASPGGITIAGIHQMEEDRVRAGIMNTLMATYLKAKQG